MIPDPIQLLEDPPELSEEEWAAVELAARKQDVVRVIKSRGFDGQGDESRSAAAPGRPAARDAYAILGSAVARSADAMPPDRRNTSTSADPCSGVGVPAPGGETGDQDSTSA